MKRFALRALLGGIGAIACMCIGGCYERVVRAEGFGADRVDTQERYRADTVVDRWFDEEILNNPPPKRDRFDRSGPSPDE